MSEKIITYRKIRLKNYRQYQQYNKDENILSEEEFNNINVDNAIFLIANKERLYGLFTLKEDSFRLNAKENECIKVNYLYIFKKYRLHNLATNILNDVEEFVKMFRYNTNYILIDTPIVYSMFYLDRGYNFYRAKKSVKHNQVTLFKKVEKEVKK